jgi:hypothetical protein
MAEVGNTYQLEPEKDEMYPSIKLVLTQQSTQYYRNNSIRKTQKCHL